jgi:hypothetical protein
VTSAGSWLSPCVLVCNIVQVLFIVVYVYLERYVKMVHVKPVIFG